MTVAELCVKLQEMPSDAVVEVVDLVGGAEDVVAVFLDKRTRKCDMGHEHQQNRVWLRVNDRFRFP